ncbi:hypothetical protein K7432_011611 [Basidiobolus ranarum]|uniref:Velvet domain-containing protein n=1 Tax=Basidiobolus ranarum TaxID=34480 RepID=A0ABR2VTX3_9FUNG
MTTTHHNFINIDEYYGDTSHNNYTLIVRQQPKRAKRSSIKDKIGEKPMDPPPIVQVKIGNDNPEDNDYLLQHPGLFMLAELVGPEDVMEEPIPATAIVGTLCSSLYKLKDINNTYGGFFIFPEISVRVEGDFRLKFKLYEIISGQSILMKCTYSDIFTVYSSKHFPGMEESTFLSRSFSDQGARIRIRRGSKMLNRSSLPGNTSRYLENKRKSIDSQCSEPLYTSPNKSRRRSIFREGNDLASDEEGIPFQMTLQEISPKLNPNFSFTELNSALDNSNRKEHLDSISSYIHTHSAPTSAGLNNSDDISWRLRANSDSHCRSKYLPNTDPRRNIEEILRKSEYQIFNTLFESYLHKNRIPVSIRQDDATLNLSSV